MLCQKKKKKGRLIIRNLSFKATIPKLSEVFSKFGSVTEISIPMKKDGKMLGFAFVQYQNTKSAILAINNLNTKEIFGRPIAVDFAFPKDKFEAARSKFEVDDDLQKISNTEEEKNIVNQDGNPEIISECQKKMKIKEDADHSLDSYNITRSESDLSEDDLSEESSEDSSDSDSSDNAETYKSSQKIMSKKENLLEKKTHPKTLQSDTNEGRTVFVRNMSFDTSSERLKEFMNKFGTVKYCLLCVDKVTEHPKGTGFVQFDRKEDAENCIQHSENALDDSFVLDGRKLYLTLALSKEEIENKLQADQKKKKDNRNLYLLSEGLIRPGSDAAEGVSQSDLMKRLRIESLKRKRLKDYHYFISTTRLCVQNLPLGLDDRKLQKIFLKAAGPKAVINEVRIMRDMKNVDGHGKGMSKGFGFINFSTHEHALQALRQLNNNPNVFTSQKRPIVEFSVENMTALNAKKQRIKKFEAKSMKDTNKISDGKSFQKSNEQVVNKQRNSKKLFRRSKQQKKKASEILQNNEQHMKNKHGSKVQCNIAKQQNKGQKKQKLHFLKDNSFAKLVQKYQQVLHSSKE